MYKNIYIKISLSILFIIIICFLSIKKINKSLKTSNVKQMKIILYYSSEKEICLQFINTIWKQITNKYKNINFVEIDINKNKRFEKIVFNELPKIYMIRDEENIINPYVNYLSYNNLENFIVNSYETIM